MTTMTQHQDLFRYGPESEAQPVAAGIKQVVLGAAAEIVQSKCWYERGAETVKCSNARTRTSYVLEGFFEISVDGQSQILGPSGCFVIPCGAAYTIRCLDAGVLLTSFASGGQDADPIKEIRLN